MMSQGFFLGEFFYTLHTRASDEARRSVKKEEEKVSRTKQLFLSRGKEEEKK